jgi:hypothetical protein
MLLLYQCKASLGACKTYKRLARAAREYKYQFVPSTFFDIADETDIKLFIQMLVERLS